MADLETLLHQWTLQPVNFSPEQWDLYRSVIHRTNEAGIPFALGGGMAAMVYAGQLRDSRDIDLYILPRDRERMQALISAAGLKDYYDQKPYDRRWIYRSCLDGMIVDVMWAMANQRSEVDEGWFRGPSFLLDGQRVSVVPPEEVLWSKLYVLQRDRCDWPDALNILYSLGPQLRWQRLLERVAPDFGLLGGLLSTFRWLCPEQAAELPTWVWQRLQLEPPTSTGNEESTSNRPALLDFRPWFTPTLDPDHRFP